MNKLALLDYRELAQEIADDRPDTYYQDPGIHGKKCLLSHAESMVGRPLTYRPIKKELGISTIEYTYIFGVRIDIKRICKKLGMGVCNSFTAQDAVDRINTIISLYDIESTECIIKN